MKNLTHWIKIVEAEERAIDAFVFDRAEASFNKYFQRWNGRVGTAKRLVGELQRDLQKIMGDLVKAHGGWIQRLSPPAVEIFMSKTGSRIGGETGTSSKKVRIYLPYPLLVDALENDEVHDEICQMFAGFVVHEFVHVVQLLKKTYTQAELNSGGATRHSSISPEAIAGATHDRYLSAPHELEAFAHTIAFDLIRVLRKVPETMRNGMMNAILGNTSLMAAKSKSYEWYVNHASDKTIQILDGMVGRLLRQHFPD